MQVQGSDGQDYRLMGDMQHRRKDAAVKSTLQKHCIGQTFGESVEDEALGETQLDVHDTQIALVAAGETVHSAVTSKGVAGGAEHTAESSSTSRIRGFSSTDREVVTGLRQTDLRSWLA